MQISKLLDAAPIGHQVATDPKRAEHVAELLRAVAHPLRIRIIALLVAGPRHVNALVEALDAKQAVVSQQLRILRMRGLVSSDRQNGFAYYSLAEPELRNLVQCMESCSLR